MSKTLVVYYSYNGNTKKIAEMIKKSMGADLFRIDTVIPYTGSYEEVVKQGQQEVNRGFKPLLKPLDIELAKYDTLIIGTPVWWYSVAPAVLTFLSGINLSGKTIIPFATNGGWIGHTFQDIKKLCPESEVVGEMNIEFSESNLKTTIDELETWIKNIRKGKDNEYIGGK